MATRQERMRDRMRGAGRVNVGDIDFGFIIPVAGETADLPEVPAPAAEPPTPPAPVPASTSRPTPNSSAKRKHLHGDTSHPMPPAPSGPAVYDLPDHTTEAGDSTTTATDRPPSTLRDASPTLPRRRHPPRAAEENNEDQDHPMTDAPPQSIQSRPHPSSSHPRGPLSSVIAATKRLSFDPSSPSSPPQPPSSSSRRRRADLKDTEMMEVTESPADAPGSGRRRRLRPASTAGVATGSSARLQGVLRGVGSNREGGGLGVRVSGSSGGDGGEEGDGDVMDEDMEDEGEEGEEEGGMGQTSSPVERRVATRRAAARKSAAAAAAAAAGGDGSSPSSRVGLRRRGARVSGGSSVAESEVVEEVSVMEVDRLGSVEEEEEGEEVEDSTVLPGREGEAETGEPHDEGEEQPEAEAEEVGEEEAAQRLGRKRPRRSLPAPSPELSSGMVEESPGVKRRRRREHASPAQQQQPAKKTRRGRPPSRLRQQQEPEQEPSPPPQPRPERAAQPKPRTKKQAKRKSKAADDDDADEAGSVPVTVQRFTKPRVSGGAVEGEDERGTDPHAEIPFANRGGVNAVDVLSKLCEELIETYMTKLEERGRAAEDAATRREQKTMYRALEAFQEEVRTRLLEHTIALDTLHALRKRVRAAQKEKLALRDEILRVRAEREQVALRMDAIRIRHETDSKEAMRHISLSSAMHDIDLAVEQGQAAPELSPAEQKKAELVNLELLMNRVADQACTRSDGGGTLRQIREFNAFLERTAAVLEGR